MPGVVMVEWLGRGGIAHTAESWTAELSRHGRDVTLVTRGGRELAESVSHARSAGAGRGPLGAHLAVMRAALEALEETKPETLVLHGSVLPQLELPVVLAARRKGVKSILVAHEAATGRSSPGSAAALRQMVRRVDSVVVHSNFVAEDVTRRTGRSDLELVPLPLPLGLVTDEGVPVSQGASVIDKAGKLVALHFGHLHRGYKGTLTALDVAAAGAQGWTFAIVGKGAPTEHISAIVVDRFLDPPDLVATVAEADAVLLPYDRASQSGAVVLAQALGAVVIASGVGGIPEQVEEETGLLLPPGAATSEWTKRLGLLRDVSLRQAIAARARQRVVRAHQEFLAGITALVP